MKTPMPDPVDYTGMPRPSDYGAGSYFTNDARLAAARLLWEHLSPVQRQDYAMRGYFTAIGRDTGREYRVSHDQCTYHAINFCIHIFDLNREHVPLEDTLLAKKVLIECDERTFLAVANH